MIFWLLTIQIIIHQYNRTITNCWLNTIYFRFSGFMRNDRHDKGRIADRRRIKKVWTRSVEQSLMSFELRSFVQSLMSFELKSVEQSLMSFELKSVVQRLMSFELKSIEQSLMSFKTEILWTNFVLRLSSIHCTRFNVHLKQSLMLF